MRWPDHLLKLISVLKKLPGVGSKSAERFAFHLIEWPEEKLHELGTTILDLKKKLKHCLKCGALCGAEDCVFCFSKNRNPKLLCVVAASKDVFSIEETREYQGLYHVMDGLFSPIQGKIYDSIDLDKLKRRIEQLGVEEIILAFDSTLEGDATSLYLKKELELIENLKLSRLALGLPMGSSLDYIDSGTLARAFAGRRGY